MSAVAVISPDNANGGAAGGACAALLNAAHAAARDLRRGQSKQILINGSVGEADLLLLPAGSEASLAVLVRPGCNLGLLFSKPAGPPPSRRWCK